MHGEWTADFPWIALMHQLGGVSCGVHGEVDGEWCLDARWLGIDVAAMRGTRLTCGAAPRLSSEMHGMPYPCTPVVDRET